MRYYTKEWYDLMQRQNYTNCLKAIPDKCYSDQEIQAFYTEDLELEIACARRCYDTPPSNTWADRLLQPDKFQPQNFLFENEETGELFHPETAEIAREYIRRERERREAAFDTRPPFEPAETIQCFQECYENMLRYGAAAYPQWVLDKVDKRLLALNRMPESIYRLLQEEEKRNQEAFKKIMDEARAVLDAQDIPIELRENFHFHDADILALRRFRTDAYLYLRKDGGWPDGTTPYAKIIFRNVSRLDREKGFMIRTKQDKQGGLYSGCQFLYHELYKTSDGYEVHILLWANKEPRYLTICCEEITIVDHIELQQKGFWNA